MQSSLSPTVQYNQPITHCAVQSACHPPCSAISLPPIVLYNQPTSNRAVQSVYHPPCGAISLSPTVHYNQPTTHSAVRSAYHPQCSTISLSPTMQYNQPIPSKHAGSAGKHCPKAIRMILAHGVASGSDPFGQNLTQSAKTKSDPGWFCTILSGMSVEERLSLIHI